MSKTKRTWPRYIKCECHTKCPVLWRVHSTGSIFVAYLDAKAPTWAKVCYGQSEIDSRKNHEVSHAEAKRLSKGSGK